MKTIGFCSLIISFLICLFGCGNKNNSIVLKPNSVFQYSTLSALLEGVYDGEMTVGELKKHGNYGIGTFNALDGEMILYEGECYKATSDSKVIKVGDLAKIPFAAICTFVPDTIIKIGHALNLKEIKHYIDSVMPSGNLLYAYKISGSFDSIVIRSVPKQQKPYVRLIEAYKAQGVYTFAHLDGILFGYKFPHYLKDVNMDDYHFHFLTTDKSKGGHLLSCTIMNGEIDVAIIRNFQLQLPDNNYFNATKFLNSKSELLKIEGGNN